MNQQPSLCMTRGLVALCSAYAISYAKTRAELDNTGLALSLFSFVLSLILAEIEQWGLMYRSKIFITLMLPLVEPITVSLVSAFWLAQYLVGPNLTFIHPLTLLNFFVWSAYPFYNLVTFFLYQGSDEYNVLLKK